MTTVKGNPGPTPIQVYPDSSISAVRSMEMAIRVGIPRIMAAALCALWENPRYQGCSPVAGHEAQIDDSGGTMPPFERHIILGPRTHRVAKRV